MIESHVHTHSTLARTRLTSSLYENKVWLKVAFIPTQSGPELDPLQVCMKIRFDWRSRSYKLDLGPNSTHVKFDWKSLTKFILLAHYAFPIWYPCLAYHSSIHSAHPICPFNLTKLNFHITLFGLNLSHVKPVSELNLRWTCYSKLILSLPFILPFLFNNIISRPTLSFISSYSFVHLIQSIYQFVSTKPYFHTNFSRPTSIHIKSISIYNASLTKYHHPVFYPVILSLGPSTQYSLFFISSSYWLYFFLLQLLFAFLYSVLQLLFAFLYSHYLFDPLFYLNFKILLVNLYFLLYYIRY